MEIGTSILDQEQLGSSSKEHFCKAEQAGVKLLLPVDAVCAKELQIDTEFATFDKDQIPQDRMGMDIVENDRVVQGRDRTGKIIVWNGPMGVFEMPNFAAGTRAVAEALAASDVVMIIGGGTSCSFGFDLAQIRQATGLTAEEIEKL